MFLIGNDSAVSWAGAAELLAWVFVIPGLALGLYSLVLYVPLAIEALREGRSARTGAS